MGFGVVAVPDGGDRAHPDVLKLDYVFGGEGLLGGFGRWK